MVSGGEWAETLDFRLFVGHGQRLVATEGGSHRRVVTPRLHHGLLMTTAQRVSPFPSVPPLRRRRRAASGPCVTPTRPPARGIDRQRLAELMAAMANGDLAAPFDLHREFNGPLTAVVRRHLRRLNVHAVPEEDVQSLAIDAALCLADCAGAWSPEGGAMPWHWAHERIRAMVHRWVGQFADSWEPDRHGGHVVDATEAWTGEDPPMLEVLATVADEDPLAALLLEAFSVVGNPRDCELLLAYTVQRQSGDPSPANTLSALHGRSPEAVRQAVSRTRRGLIRLVADDPHYAPLTDILLVA